MGTPCAALRARRPLTSPHHLPPPHLGDALVFVVRVGAASRADAPARGEGAPAPAACDAPCCSCGGTAARAGGGAASDRGRRGGRVCRGSRTEVRDGGMGGSRPPLPSHRPPAASPRMRGRSVAGSPPPPPSPPPTAGESARPPLPLPTAGESAREEAGVPPTEARGGAAGEGEGEGQLPPPAAAAARSIAEAEEVRGEPPLPEGGPATLCGQAGGWGGSLPTVPPPLPAIIQRTWTPHTGGRAPPLPSIIQRTWTRTRLAAPALESFPSRFATALASRASAVALICAGRGGTAGVCFSRIPSPTGMQILPSVSTPWRAAAPRRARRAARGAGRAARL